MEERPAPETEPYRSTVDAFRYPPGDPRNGWGPGDPEWPWEPDRPIRIVDMRPRNLCAACGFLSMVSMDRSLPGYFEVNGRERSAGDLYQLPGGQEARPRCFANAFNLEMEAHSYLEGTKEERINNVIHRARDCTKWWVPYVHFRSPKEHLERYEMLQLERDRAELQVRLADMEQRERDRFEYLQQRAEELAAQRERFTFRAFLIIGILGVALGVAAIGATLYPEELRALVQSISAAISSQVQT